MQKSLWILLALLVVSAAPAAHANAFTPLGTYTLECTGPCASDPTATFGVTAIDFTVFGHTVDVTGLSLQLGDLYGWNIVANSLGNGGELSLTNVTSDTPIVAPITLAFPVSNESGLFLPGMAPTPTPEPGSVALMLLGVGMVLAVRKRIGLSFSRANDQA